MGGRIASQVLADPAQPLSAVRGLVLLGYPLHPPGQPDRPRIAHLPHLATPTLVVQGSEDPFGTEDEVRHGLEGNLCRCTGYHNIVKAVLSASGQKVGS